MEIFIINKHIIGLIQEGLRGGKEIKKIKWAFEADFIN